MTIAKFHRVRNLQLLWPFAILFILFGLAYSSVTPIFENSDETLHYPYIKHLADGKGLPQAIPDQLWEQEGTQPPLYYAIVAATTFWINSDNLPDHLQPNPHWRFTDFRPVLNDNQNVVLHGPMDAFPYRRAALAIHIGRWWSLLFGLITVVCTFLIGRHLFPGRLPLIVTATAITALTPQFIRVSTTVSNDSLSAALASLTVLLALRFTAPQAGSLSEKSPAAPVQFTDRHALILGLLSGLALLTKLSSLATAFLAAYILVWRLFFQAASSERQSPKIIRWLTIVAAVVIIFTGWWFVRNYLLYDEWLAIDTHLELAGRGDLSLSETLNLRAEIERAYWATFGWGQIRPPEWIYQLLSWFSWLGLLSLLVAITVPLIRGRSRQLSPDNRAINLGAVAFLMFWLGLNLFLYLRWVMIVGSVSHTRLIFPAIAAISLLLAAGWHAILPRRLEAWFSGLAIVTFLALNIYSVGWLIYPAFHRDEFALNATALWLKREPLLNYSFLDRLQLQNGGVFRGYGSPPTDFKGDTVTEGDPVTITVKWGVNGPIDENYSAAAFLLAPDGSVLARRETFPGLGLEPTRYLNPDETVIDIYPLTLTRTVSSPVVARAVVNLFDFNSSTRTGFPAVDATGREITPVVGYIKVVPKQWPRYQPMHQTEVNFNNAILLKGYDLAADLTLYWESLTPVNENFNLFIHLLDSEGNIVAQADAAPTHNAYPTSWWASGETIAASHRLPSSPDATRVRFGFYSLASGQRLVITESTLPSRDNAVEIPLP